MDGGAWWATVHGSQESGTTERLYFHFKEGGKAGALCIKKLGSRGCAPLSAAALFGGEGAWRRAAALQHSGP